MNEKEAVEEAREAIRARVATEANLLARHDALLERVTLLERALELIAEHADLDRDRRKITEFDRYIGIARAALDG